MLRGCGFLRTVSKDNRELEIAGKPCDWHKVQGYPQNDFERSELLHVDFRGPKRCSLPRFLCG